MGRIIAAVLAVAMLGAVVFFAPGRSTPSTAEAALERVRVLERERDELLQTLQRKDAELAAARTTLSTDFKKRLAEVKDLHAQREADLSEQLSSVRQDVTTVMRERIVLQEIVNSREHAPGMLQARFNQERMVWFILLLAVLLPLVLVASRYSAMRHAAGPALVRRASVAHSLSEGA